MGQGKKPEGKGKGTQKSRSFRKELLLFIVLFFIIWLFSYLLTKRYFGYVVFFQGLVAREVSFCLKHLDYRFIMEGNSLTFYTRHGGEELVVIPECTGIYTSIIYFSIVGAYPARVWEKLVGLLMGIPAIHILNLARMVFVSLILYHKRELFHLFHGYLWQVSFVIFMLLLVIFWLSKIVRVRSA